jgi:hypothetical protein
MYTYDDDYGYSPTSLSLPLSLSIRFLPLPFACFFVVVFCWALFFPLIAAFCFCLCLCASVLHSVYDTVFYFLSYLYLFII